MSAVCETVRGVCGLNQSVRTQSKCADSIEGRKKKKELNMKKVLKVSVTIAVTTIMVGLAATQARADRVAFYGGCFGGACAPVTSTMLPGSLMVEATSVSLADLGTQVGAAYGGSFSATPSKSGGASIEAVRSIQSTRSGTGRVTFEPVPNTVDSSVVTVPEPTT